LNLNLLSLFAGLGVVPAKRKARGIGNKNPHHTKKGPGRVHLQGPVKKKEAA
jgi:hypothetical protein